MNIERLKKEVLICQKEFVTFVEKTKTSAVARPVKRAISYVQVVQIWDSSQENVRSALYAKQN